MRPGRRLRRRLSSVEVIEARICLSTISLTEHLIDDSQIVGIPSALVADVDGDNDSDIVFTARPSAGDGGSAGWYENIDGLGTFQLHSISIQPGTHAVSLTDIDSDGDPDLIVERSGLTAWLENSATSRFEVEHPITTHSTFLTRISDIDLDGDADLVAAEGGKLLWYRNDGSGQFAKSDPFFEVTVTAPASRSIQALETTDIDADGDVDVLILDNSTGITGNIRWFKNSDGLGTFSSAEVVGATFQGSAFPIDIDGDHDVDVIAGSDVFENVDGAGTFQLNSEMSAPAIGTDRVAADLDGDELEDVISFVFDEIRVYLGIGTTDVRLAQTLNIGGSILELVAADLDGDKDLDLLFGRPGTLAWFENVGQGQFDGLTVITAGLARPSSIASGDFDNDGDVDLVVSTLDDGRILLYENADGAGGFAGRRMIDQQRHATSVHVADVDGDGHQDLVVTLAEVLGTTVFAPSIVWYRNLDGAGSFGDALPIGRSVEELGAFDGESSVIQVVDFDGDGDVDVIGAGTQNGGEITLYENRGGKGQFITRSIMSDVGAQWVNAVDLNADGDRDLVIISNERLAWAQSLGPAGFGPLNYLVTEGERWVSNVATRDFDGDGDSDLVVSESFLLEGRPANDLLWIENVGAGGLLHRRVIMRVDQNDQFESSSLTPADLDGDGDTDLIFAGAESPSRMGWVENLDGRIVFSEPMALAHPNSLLRYFPTSLHEVIDVDGDGDDDLVTVQPGDGRLAWTEIQRIGDSNRDGVFDSGDLITALAAGKYEDDIPGNASMADGDWDGSGDFDSNDLVFALAAGHYEKTFHPAGRLGPEAADQAAFDLDA